MATLAANSNVALALTDYDSVTISCRGPVAVESVSGLGLTAGKIAEFQGTRTFGPFTAAGSLKLTTQGAAAEYEVADGDARGGPVEFVMVGGQVAGVAGRDRVPLAVNGAIDIRGAGAKCDGVSRHDVTTTASATCAISSASANFTQADVGKACAVLPYSDTGLTPRWGTISAVTSPTACTAALSASPGVLTNAQFVYGTDDTIAIKAALAAAKLISGVVFFPIGITVATDTLTIPTGCTIRGAANFSTGGKAKDFTYAGSSLVLTKFVANGFVHGGDSADANSPKGIIVRDMNIDCLNLAANAYRAVNGRTNSAYHATFVRGTAETYNSSATSRVQHCVFMGQQAGNVVQLVGDSTFLYNIVLGAGNGFYNVKCSNGDDINISHNHLWKDSTLSTMLGGQIFLSFNSANLTAGGVSVTNNKFDTSYGPHIYVKVSGNSTARGVSIVGNIAMQNDAVPNAAYPYIQTEVQAGSILRGLIVSSNLGRGSWNDPTKARYTHFIDNSATAGTIYGATVVANAIDNCDALYNALTPTYSAGNITIAGAGTVVAVG